jgi:hypothetical protein
MATIPQFAPYTSLFGFIVGLPTLIGAYYQSWKARQENRLARQGLVYSENCLEFIMDDGTSINLVPLETLHTLPKPGDVVLLPGTGAHDPELPQHAAYQVSRIEYIYTRVENRMAHHGQARLAKAVAHVDPLTARSSVSPIETVSRQRQDGSQVNATGSLH